MLEKGRIMGSVEVERSRNLDEVLVAVSEDLKAILKNNDKDKLFTRVSLPEKVMAPVRRGTIMGTVSVFKGDEIIAETSLITLEGAQKMRFADYLSLVIKRWIYISR